MVDRTGHLRDSPTGFTYGIHLRDSPTGYRDPRSRSQLILPLRSTPVRLLLFPSTPESDSYPSSLTPEERRRFEF